MDWPLCRNELRVERWNYKPEVDLGNETHIGPYAEEFKEKFGVGDGRTINMIDAIGVLFAAVKGLESRMAKTGDVSHATGIS